MITRKTSYREDNLITLVHKFCVKEAAQLIGPLYGISEDEVDEPELLFDYELFAEVIQNKIAATFNDKHLELFHAMLKMVRYLGNKENRGEDGSENESLFGVNTFAPVWEAMVDKIFGKLPQGVAKDKFNPHLRWNDGCRDEKLDESEEEIVLNDPKRSSLRPDTIMVMGEGVYILDSKYYKYGLTKSPAHLPGAESVCKQMAYAEYVKTHWKEILSLDSLNATHSQNDAPPKPIYNAFIMPYCADAEGASASSATFQMKRVGYIYGDWKDCKRPYHKIHCILLDMKSVMRNYANNPTAQSELAGVIGD